MSKYSGYMDNVAVLDLCTGELSSYPWSEDEQRLYIGGCVMASKILSDCLKGSEDALKGDAPIVITTGPLTGTGAPCSDHFFVSSLSPISGGVTHSSCGGEFGLYLKKAGFDALILKGKCEKPTWLEIHNASFTLNDAKALWGLDTAKAQKELHSLVDEKQGCRVKCGTLVIGVAGEKLVRYASLLSGEREAEHCDLGAVFGAKKLKGIVVSGNHEIAVADVESTRKVNIEWSDMLHRHPITGSMLPKLGTMGFVKYLSEQGMLPTENFKKGSFESVDEISGECFAEKHNVACRSCTYCPIRCERSVMLSGELVRGPELHTVALLGSNILNSDLKLIARWEHEMRLLGLDAVLCAETIAWAMEANESGVFKSELEFGRTSKISGVLGDIAYRKGKGDELSLGAELLGKKYGGAFAYSIKPLELLAVDRYMGVSAGKKGEPDKASVIELANALQVASAASGQCRLLSVANIPSCLFTDPDGLAAFIVKAALPIGSGLFSVLSLLPDSVTAMLPHFVHTRELKAALGMDITLAQYLEVGRLGIKTDNELNKKLGVETEKAIMPSGIVASSKAAKKSLVSILKEKAENLKSFDFESLPVLSLIKKDV